MNRTYSPVIGRSAWTAADVGGKSGLTINIDTQALGALRRLLDRTADRAPTEVRRKDVDDSVICALMARVREELATGKGAVVLAGAGMETLSPQELARVFWALGTHLGTAVPQSRRGDRVGHVRMPKDSQSARGYLRDIELRPHTDFHEILGLASVSMAASGGVSGLVSSHAIYNAILREHPDLLDALFHGFPHQFDGSNLRSKDDVPILCNVDGVLSCYFYTPNIMAAAKALGGLPPALRTAIDVFRAYSLSSDHLVEFLLEPGEIMFWHNFVVLHSRTAFEDTDEATRLLYRLWIHSIEPRPMHPTFRLQAAALDAAHSRHETALPD